MPRFNETLHKLWALNTVQKIKHEKRRTDDLLYMAAITLIERRARLLLMSHKDLDEFSMTIDGWMITRKNGKPYISSVDPDSVPAYAIELGRTIDAFTEMGINVHLNFMKFTAEGPNNALRVR